MSAIKQEPAPDQSVKPDGLLEAARGALEGAMRVAEASLALLRAELRLAGRSAMTIVWLAFLLIFLGASAWLSLTAAVAVGLYQLSGNLFLGIAAVALANVAGVLAVVLAMRRRWHDLSLPHTRALMVRDNAPAGVSERGDGAFTGERS